MFKKYKIFIYYFTLNFFRLVIFIFFLRIGFLVIKKECFESQLMLRPFECGFDIHNLNLNNFSLHYYFMALIFLIFDVEIIIVYPLIITNDLLTENLFYIIVFLFIFLLMLLLFFEWNSKIIEWSFFFWILIKFFEKIYISSSLKKILHWKCKDGHPIEFEIV